MSIEEMLDSLTLEDLAGQVLCYDVYDKDDPAEVEKIIKKIKPGGIFLTGMSAEKIALYTDMVNKYTKIPVIIASDIEKGPETAIKGAGYIPHQMAWGACDDENLIERAGRATAQICRKNGVHWTYSPIVDINYNFRNPECNIRAVSDKPDHVIKMTSAFIRGAEENGYMVTACKHFPGQGMDERNSHFCTTTNPMTQEEWMSTYGYIYKTMIDKGIPSIMVGHGSVESFEEEIDPVLGALPAVLSHSLMTKLLKERLGFEGCIVSDAMSMIGVCARVDKLEELAVRYLNAGGDMILFPEPTDFDHILKAIQENTLSLDRLKDAVKRILRLKQKARLFEDQKAIVNEIPNDVDFHAIAQEIADKSIVIERDVNGILPLKLKKGSRVLMLNMVEPYFHQPPTGHELDAMKAEFERYGMHVDVMTTAKHKEIQNVLSSYDLVTLNCKMSSQDYHGATMRIGWNNIMVLWRGYVLQHPNFVFVSFGDPYKLFDMPYLKEYVNAFSYTEASQRAVVKVLLGEIKATGKNPVEFKGFFERGV